MNTYLIYAAEQTYRGLHGIFDVNVYECTEAEAHEIGNIMSRELMERYGLPKEDLSDLSDEEFSEYMEENVYYDIYKVDFNKRGSKSLIELKEEAYNSWSNFVKEYCVKE